MSEDHSSTNTKPRLCMPAKIAEQKPRLSRSDWIAAAVAALTECGIDRVRVEALASQLKVSKGSFYWHFKDRKDLLDSILANWQETSTFAIQSRLAEEDLSLSQRLFRYIELPLRSRSATRAADLELAIQGWARRSKEVAEAVAAVDQARTDGFVSLFVELGLSKSEASSRAHRAYAYVRYVAHRRDLDDKSRRKLVADFHREITEDLE